ncbi:MAG TPA: hypothetical protein VIO38_10755 [Rariglobus sp.]
MPAIGQIERATQRRVVALLQKQLGYDYLSDWSDRENNRNIEADYLKPWLAKRGVDTALITRALLRRLSGA